MELYLGGTFRSVVATVVFVVKDSFAGSHNRVQSNIIIVQKRTQNMLQMNLES